MEDAQGHVGDYAGSRAATTETGLQCCFRPKQGTHTGQSCWLHPGGGVAHPRGLLSIAAGTALESTPSRPPHSAPGGTAPWSELSWDREAVAMVTLHAGVHECLQHLHGSCGLYLTPFLKKKKKSPM